MPSIRQNDVIANLPADELQVSLRGFLQPVTQLLPDVRLRAVAELITQGIVASQSPIVTRIARGTRFTDVTVWPTCKRAYRFLNNSTSRIAPCSKGYMPWHAKPSLRKLQTTW